MSKIKLPIALSIFLSGWLLLNPISAKDFQISTLMPDVYLHKSYQVVDGFGRVDSNGLVVVKGNDAYIVDTPWSEADTDALLTWMEEQGLQPKASISTHSHDDRTAGIALLNSKSVATYASELTNSILSKSGKPLAKFSFPGPDFSLGDNLIEIFYAGGGHTIDNLVVWLPEAKLLYGGCLVRSENSKDLGYVGEASIKDWPNTIEKIFEKFPSVAIVVPGHGAVGDAQLLSHTQSLANEALGKVEFETQGK